LRHRPRFGFAELPEVRLHYAEAGAGPLVLLLHGFPELWYSWRHQLPALAAAGFHAVAPDLRGYNLSSKPAGVAAYRVERLAADVEALVSHFGAERAALVGHDWGGAIAWVTAALHPDRVERLVAVNAPHPVSFDRGLLSPRQLLRSWYVFFFQLPWLPELAARAAGRRWARHALPFPDEEVERYAEAWAQPGAATAALNWYRALFRRNPLELRRALRRPVVCPALVVWGERDPYLGRELAHPPPELVADARVERLPEQAHWPHCENPERVNELLLEWLRASAGW
jgi:pimeloyl-ACP methyl ester carboxylesterase